MLPKISLMEELKKGGYEASLITTYNAYLPFYEDVVLRRLVNAGVRHNVLLMDAQQYAASLAAHPPRIAGRQYTLLPVKVPGAFHPKLVFLTGKSKAAILIGSHNMTLAGFGFNREITNVVGIQGESDGTGVGIAQALWAEIDSWLDSYTPGIPDHVLSMVRRVKEFAPWLEGKPASDSNIKLLAGRPGSVSLWEQLASLLHGETARVSVGGAFFDQEFSFLQRLRRDLKPHRLTIAVEPDTVQMPTTSLEGASFVRAERLGCDENAEERYLHAKFLLVEQSDGTCVLATGSANPSRPAWLAEGSSGNVELMLARTGKDALPTANALGCGNIHSLPPLTPDDWQAIQINQMQEEFPPANIRTGIALAEGTRIMFDADLLTDRSGLTFTLTAADGSSISDASKVSIEGRFASLNFDAGDIQRAAALHAFSSDEQRLNLILHHATLVEEQARSGTQRKFRDALLSLETDTPDIGLLIQCIDKIIFDEENPSAATGLLKAHGAAQTKAEAETESPETLAIDVSEMKKHRKKRRLDHSSDFAYLLDALIYHLRIQGEKSHDEVDRLGRNEEEQIGADDDLESEIAQLTPEKQADLLRVCNAKVRTLVNRMTSQLKLYADGKQPFTKILVRLLGVLAVLRELRNCDGRVAWVEKGKTTVRKEQRLALLEAVMFNLFEGEAVTQSASLLHLQPLGEDFYDSDEVARLKGLLLWLAWDCGLTMNLQKPHWETPEACEQRMKQNAMVLALAQTIGSDGTVTETARQSIGGLTSSELDWLKDIQRLADICSNVGQNQLPLRQGEAAEAGDIAFHRTAENWIARIVAGRNGNKVVLMALKKDKPRVSYQAAHLTVGDPVLAAHREPPHKADLDTIPV
ncbi:hypothetical protein EV130_110145 [Rhizobium azibense]|uniref:Uncharacterized protein n=1 Tax=Rhizobium azibense TaxID=1136135 RepID=A0A4R3QJI1_9HYPH|nr:hypothetical protein [Rhizobium azibense]TCU21801.1 hypothetical protein EV130_110145 [Rhizobium azibense]